MLVGGHGRCVKSNAKRGGQLMITVLHQGLQTSINPQLLGNICGIDSSSTSSSVDIVVSVVRNKGVKRALEVVGSIGEMWDPRITGYEPWNCASV
jgi:hypothetical protein